MDRACLVVQAGERAREIKSAAAAAGLELGSRLRKIEGERILERWRWGRIPIEGGGWLVTFMHDPGAAWSVEGEAGRREVRHAVMRSQFGWGVFAACEYQGGERLGCYDGEVITAEQWGRLGKYEGRRVGVEEEAKEGQD